MLVLCTLCSGSDLNHSVHYILTLQNSQKCLYSRVIIISFIWEMGALYFVLTYSNDGLFFCFFSLFLFLSFFYRNSNFVFLLITITYVFWCPYCNRTVNIYKYNAHRGQEISTIPGVCVLLVVDFPTCTNWT